MQRREIPKRSGGVRVIYAPSPDERAALRALVPELTARAQAACPHAHAFLPGRSPRTAAEIHARQPWVLSCDLRDFFDSVRREQIAAAGVPDAILDQILVEGAPRQGLPTSPAAANLAAAALDARIVAALPPGCTFTRYADDLTVGAPSREAVSQARAILEREVAVEGWTIHPRKWSLQDARAGRVVICGVVVGGDRAPSATRTARRRLRAARHQAARGDQRAVRQARGLAEWCAMREPVLALLRRRLGGREPSAELLAALGTASRQRRTSLRRTAEELDLRAYLRAHRQLTAEPVHGVDPARAALGLARTFGAAWQDWLRGAAQRGCSAHDAIYWLPVRGRPSDGLGATLLRWRREIPDLYARTADLAVIAEAWDRMDPALRQLPLTKLLVELRARVYVGAQDLAFARECARWGISSERYPALERRWLGHRTVPYDAIPRGEIAALGGLRAEILRRDDPRALWAGQHTACCQYPGGVGESCAWHAALDPQGALLAIWRGEAMIAQSWLWRRDDALVADNCETLGAAPAELPALYERVARALIGRLGITEVRIGVAGDLPIPEEWARARAVPAPARCYSDASTQRVIACQNPADRASG